MELVELGYEIAYTLFKGLVRSSASGNFEGNDYSPSVRITSSNVYDVENSKTGFIDAVEQKVIFKLICPDNHTAGVVAGAIKEKFKKGEALKFHGGFPSGDQRVVTISEPYDHFLKPSDLKTSDKSVNKA